MNARLKNSTLARKSCPAQSPAYQQAIAVLFVMFFALSALAQTISPFNLPLYFEGNKNQTEFLSRGSGYQILISADGAQITLHKSAVGLATARMHLVGSRSDARIDGAGELPGKINYFVGNDPSKWQTGLSTFSRVQLAGVYPGIDLVYHGNQRQLEYDFAIAPGANPDNIKIRFDGVDKMSIAADGELVLKIGDSEIRQPRPEIYQTVAGGCQIISGGYKILDAHTVAFAIGSYDHSLPLVIDPVLSYSAFFGGNTSDTAWAIARDVNSNLYIAGQTVSTKFATVGAYQTNFAGGPFGIGDAFVAKFDSSATNLIYLTYLGGSDDEGAYCIAVDTAGDAYVAGETDSPNFPTNNALYQKIPSMVYPGFGIYAGSGFVTELNTNGSSLIYSTYLGSTAQSCVNGIAVDSSDNAYVVGFTYAATNFPVTTNALLTHLACSNNILVNANAFVTEIASNDTGLVYSTYLGGTNFDVAAGVALDAGNNVYVAGYTASFNFPLWNVPTNIPTLGYLNGITNQGLLQSTFDGFAAKFPPLATHPSSITNLIYSTFLGGSNNDVANGIAADGAGNAYVTGWTSSTNFPVVNTPAGLFSFLITNGINLPIATNVFLTKIASNGSAILDSAVFGGNVLDIGNGVAVDSAGDAFVVGQESSPSTNFPTMNAPGSLNSTNSSGLSSTNSGGYDVFVAAFNANWSTMDYVVCIGGNQDDIGYGIALDSATNVYITGNTASTNYPTQGAGLLWFNGTNVINGTNFINGAAFAGTNDAFLTKIALGALPTGPQITNPPVNITNGVGAEISFAVDVTGTSPFTYQWQYGGSNLVDGGSISGSLSNILTLANIQTTNAGSYVVIVTNNWGSASVTDTLTVLQSPIISPPLTNETVGIDSTVTFVATTFGTPPLYYQWLTNGVDLTNNVQFGGVTNFTLTITNAQVTNSGIYTIVVTNLYGSVTDSATLTVLPAPMFTSISVVSNNFTNGLRFVGVGGQSDQEYAVFGTTNLQTPIADWTGIAVFDVDGQGHFNITLPPTSEFFFIQSNYPEEFFILESQ